MHTELITEQKQEQDAIELIKKAIKGLDLKSILEANHIKLSDAEYNIALTYAALPFLVGKLNSDSGNRLLKRALDTAILDNTEQ